MRVPEFLLDFKGFGLRVLSRAAPFVVNQAGQHFDPLAFVVLLARCQVPLHTQQFYPNALARKLLLKSVELRTAGTKPERSRKNPRVR